MAAFHFSCSRVVATLFRVAGQRNICSVTFGQSRTATKIKSSIPRYRGCRLTLGFGGIFLGFHPDGERPRLFQPQSYSLQNVLAAERKARAQVNLLWAFICKTFEVIFVILRTIHMVLVISPLVLTSPLALYSSGFRHRYWFRLLVYTIERCGPVYVKLGQWAATRRDLFPQEMCEQLAKLQRHAQIHDWDHTQRVLERVLGGEDEVNQVFLQFDRKPIGSGCCAQVYLALINESNLRNGSSVGQSASSSSGMSINYPGLRKGKRNRPTPVAVKVLHPNIREQFQRDLGVLRTLTAVLSTVFPSLRWLNLSDSLEEFAYSMRVQLDLTTEAENMLQFRKDFDDTQSVYVFPRPILPLCYPDVIVQTYEGGTHMSQLLSSSEFDNMPQDQRTELAEKGVDLLLKMVFANNFVHADLHPGNILVRGLGQGPGKLQLVVLDSGIVASLNRTDFRNFFDTFTAIVKGDGRQVGKLFLEHSVNECHDSESFVEEMASLVKDLRSGKGYGLTLSAVDVGDLLLRVFRTLRDHRVKLDANFASVILAIMILEGLGRSLDPNMDLVWKATPYILQSKLKESYFRPKPTDATDASLLE